MGVAAGFGIFGKEEWYGVGDVIFGMVGYGILPCLSRSREFSQPCGRRHRNCSHMEITPAHLGGWTGAGNHPQLFPLGILLLPLLWTRCVQVCPMCILHSHHRLKFEHPGMRWPRALVQVGPSSCGCCLAGSLWPHWDELRTVTCCSLQRLIFGIGHMDALEFVASSGAFMWEQ